MYRTNTYTVLQNEVSCEPCVPSVCTEDSEEEPESLRAFKAALQEQDQRLFEFEESISSAKAIVEAASSGTETSRSNSNQHARQTSGTDQHADGEQVEAAEADTNSGIDTSEADHASYQKPSVDVGSVIQAIKAQVTASVQAATATDSFVQVVEERWAQISQFKQDEDERQAGRERQRQLQEQQAAEELKRAEV